MRRKFLLALIGVLTSSFAFANSPPPLDQKAIQESIIRSQALIQGDIESLNKAKAEFTQEGAKKFGISLTGFLDDKGAPTFSQTFTPDPDRELEINGEHEGLIMANLKGIQKQTSNASTTTYDGMVEVGLDGISHKIAHSKFVVKPCASTPGKPCGTK